ncbi:DUF6587 family protein [Cupriavidus sp. AU9028]|uniref:DUF6587 family protein n=1 Tax=Cupriavidus sp. AU9028 TaxID=2871157 RepID=UPI001C95559C|nr:DUF6587 family protein [Cupriavidus sp. AU9028]MBY4896924.1 hypothetical protein [Cupriavidus sp. AU9028]
MSLYQAFEALLVPAIVLVCAISVAARYMPRTRERIKAGLAARLGGGNAQGWRAALVRRLAPAQVAGCASGCDSGGCNTCGSATGASAAAGGTRDQPPQEQTIRFVRRR